MFLVLIHYVAPPEQVAALRPRHREFLHQHYRSGLLVCSGPRPDQRGGVVLARSSSSRAELETIFAADPYALAGVATHEVVEFDVKSHADGFERFM